MRTSATCGERDLRDAAGEGVERRRTSPFVRRASRVVLDPGLTVAASRAGHRAGGDHPFAGGDEQILHRLLVFAEGAGVADADGEPLAAFDGRGDRLAAQGRLDDVLNVADVDAVAGRLLAVDVDLQVAFADDLVGEDVDRAGDLLEHGGDLLRDLLDLVQVVAEDLHADHRAHAGGQHVDAVDDRLGPDVAPAGHLDDGVHFLEQVVLGFLPEEQAVGEWRG